MAANAVPFRSTIFYTTAGVPASAGSILTVGANGTQNFTSNLALNTLTASTISMQSTTIALGQSTNQRYTNFTNGSFSSTLMTSTLTSYNSLSTVTKVSMSQDGRLQYALQSVPSTLSYYQLARSVDTGVTWNTLNTSTMGLPQGSLAYQSTVSGTPTYSNFSQSATGQYALAAASGGQLYVSNNANSATPVYTPANVGGAPYAYLPMETTPPTDMMGNTTITVTGSAPLVAGKVGTSAINLANTAGGTATNYVRGTWSGAANFTVSFWFNAQSLANYVNLFTSYNSTVTIYINPSTFYIAIYVGGTNIPSTTAILTNRWYNVTAVYQNGGTCSLYLNNSLVASGTASWNSSLVSSYALGTSVVDQSSSLNGYIDDFRLYNFAAPNVMNPFIYLPLDGNTTDAMGNTTITQTGSPGYVFGAPVGTRTLSLVNPTTASASQYIRGTWSNPTTFSVSGWFNIQSYTGGLQFIFSTGGTGANSIVLFVNTSNVLCLQTPSSGSYVSIISSPPIVFNQWYYFAFTILPSGGTCTLYFNNSTFTGTSTTNVNGSNTFGIGTYDSGATSGAFNGYIDDIKIYNYAISFSPIMPMNWSHTAVSGTGQYMMAAAANGGVFCSSNYGATWSQLTASQIPSLVPTGGSAKTLMGPIIQPNNAAATAATWSANGVTWTASASTTLPGGYEVFKAFDTVNGNRWVTNTGMVYNTSGNTSGMYTTIQGIGSIQGDWLQLQTSIPLVMYSYQFAPGFVVANLARIPKNFYIVGSNDGSTWYPIQTAVGGSNPSTTSYTLINNTIIVNSTASQTFGTGTITGTTYSTTANSYIYFRLIATSIYTSTSDVIDLGEWYINFATPMPLLTAPATAPSTATSAVTVTPNMTNLAAANWSTPNGVTWTVSASTTYAGFDSYKAFDNALTSSWNNTSQTYTTTTNTSGVNTTASGVAGQITGDYIQLQSSVPLVINSYQLATGGGNLQIPSTFYIVGSNDNSTWFAIQKCVAASTASAPATVRTIIPGTITVATSGSQTFGTTSLTTTTYSTTTNAYTYFRIIGTATFGTTTYLEIGGWDVNFTAYTPNPVNALAITNGGQTQLVAATGTTMPNSTAATVNSWTANGVTWTASQSSAANGSSYLGYLAFNHALTAPDWACGNAIALYTSATPGVPNANTAVVSNVTGLPSGTTITGEWLEIQSSVPLIMYSYMSASGGTAIYAPRTYNIIGSNDRTNWFNLHSASHSTNPTTTAFSTYTPYIFVNYSGSQIVTGQATSTVTTATTSYATNAYTYFRLVVTSIFTGNIAEIGEWFINFQAGSTYLSTNYGSTWSTVCTTPPTAPSLATSGNGQYTITGTGQLATVYSNAALTSYTTPTLTGINSNINCASISSTGQNMIILTQGTTNNVFYSTNFGATFTGMTVGTAPMTSCAISADGNEIMVSNAANVWTLNRNTQGFSITMGNQSGLINQGQNSIAIGNLAGVTNQSANSIILNASGAVQDAYNPGFFVSPILPQATSTQTSVNLLGYGADGQVVQSGITVLSDSRIGIGTTSPIGQLHLIMPTTLALMYNWTNSYAVFGAGGSTGSGVGIAYGSGTGVNTGGQLLCVTPGVAWQPMNYSALSHTFNVNAYNSSSVVIASNGCLGIGTTNPNFPFTCMGMAACFGWNNSGTTYYDPQYVGVEGIALRTYSGGYGIIATSANTTLALGRFGAGAIAGFSYSPAIGTACSGVGSISVTSSATAYNTGSDSRLKENIQDVADIRGMLNKLRPRTYHFIKDENKENQIGFIAQEVRENFPQYVSGQESETEYLALDYGKFSPFAISACKDLYLENDALKIRVAELESQVSSQSEQLTTQSEQLTTQSEQLAAQSEKLTTQSEQLTEVLSRLAALESK